MKLEWSMLKEVPVLIVSASKCGCMDVWYDRTVYA